MAELKDAVFEVGFVFSVKLGGDLKIDVGMILNGETKTLNVGVVELGYRGCLGEVLNEQLIVGYELVVVKGNWVLVGTGDVLVVTADIRDDVDEFVEIGGAVAVDLVRLWPTLVDKHASGPAEVLPDGLGDKRRERMQHNKDLLEGGLEEWNVFPEFFAFDEPVGVLVPNKVV